MSLSLPQHLVDGDVGEALPEHVPSHLLHGWRQVAVAGLFDFEKKRRLLVPCHAGHVDDEIVDVLAAGERLHRGADLKERALEGADGRLSTAERTAPHQGSGAAAGLFEELRQFAARIVHHDDPVVLEPV